MDREFLEAVAVEVRNPMFTVLDRQVSPAGLLSVIGRLRSLLGMRYHSLLFSALAGTPFYAIVYHHKGKELVRATGMEAYAQELGDGTQAENRDLDVAEILERIRYLWSNEVELRERLNSGMSRLRAREESNGKVLRNALERLG
jgi:polysaccharide pyruvyl transferase WcaK-like protein